VRRTLLHVIQPHAWGIFNTSSSPVNAAFIANGNGRRSGGESTEELPLFSQILETSIDSQKGLVADRHGTALLTEVCSTINWEFVYRLGSLVLLVR
jgi:hypothetical protein